MIHSLISEHKSDRQSSRRSVFSDFNALSRISDRAEVVSFVEESITTAKSIFNFGWRDEIANKSVVILKLVNILKSAFALNIIDVWKNLVDKFQIWCNIYLDARLNFRFAIDFELSIDGYRPEQIYIETQLRWKRKS